jgi:hypothetical protein
MQIDAILTFRTYTPKKIKKGMLFLITSDEYTPIVYQLSKTPKKGEDYSVLGLPVYPYVINPAHKGKGSHVLLSPDAIEWMSDEYGEVREITVEDFNRILTEFEGKVKMEVIDGSNTPFLLNDRAILSYPEEIFAEI